MGRPNTSVYDYGLAAKVEGWQPMDNIQNPSYGLYRIINSNLRLYACALESDNRNILEEMQQAFNGTFRQLRSMLTDQYGPSFFSVLEKYYKKLATGEGQTPSRNLRGLGVGALL